MLWLKNPTLPDTNTDMWLYGTWHHYIYYFGRIASSPARSLTKSTINRLLLLPPLLFLPLQLFPFCKYWLSLVITNGAARLYALFCDKKLQDCSTSDRQTDRQCAQMIFSILNWSKVCIQNMHCVSKHNFSLTDSLSCTLCRARHSNTPTGLLQLRITKARREKRSYLVSRTYTVEIN